METRMLDEPKTAGSFFTDSVRLPVSLPMLVTFTQPGCLLTAWRTASRGPDFIVKTRIYRATNPAKDGTFRHVEIRTGNKDWKVQARKGYYAIKPES